ncbi:SulP family inorganic anion transporter [uncultured Thiodictyon sp.]|uniref:SulP family inorganic anion transporter n=1 Tax=uncultured Thiodictyon sp. TaxID=1846217 RepID=UPI003454B503
MLCIAASQLRLGALADFLSRPILVGFLNGIALHIISALTQGFAIGGADSRTAMSDSAGGRTQLTGIVSARGMPGSVPRTRRRACRPSPGWCCGASIPPWSFSTPPISNVRRSRP